MSIWGPNAKPFAIQLAIAGVVLFVTYALVYERVYTFVLEAISR